MKKNLLMLTSTVLLIFLIPFIGAFSFNILNGDSNREFSVGELSSDLSISDKTLKIYNCSTQSAMEMNFEEYIVGVLIGEMPASYELEALKAQAVAARSYILSRMEYYSANGSADEHHGCNICTNSQHCKAWLSVDEANQKWGSDWSEKYLNKLKKAVDETKGEYMTYENQTVKAFFFSSSNGKTENVEDVWGGSYPYLKSVSSEGDTTAPDNESSVEFSKDDFIQKLKSKNPDIEITPLLKDMIGDTVKTEGGNVKTIRVGGKEFKGTEIRSLFSLRSAAFTISVSDDNETVVFTVNGYGHGVGMSQYGANFMAKQGKTYDEILSHYYSGITISKMPIS